MFLAPVAIVAVIAREIFYIALALEHEYMVYNLIHEIAVVRHHYHTPLEIAQVLLEHLQGLNIEVICGLVENKEIGVAHEHRA